MPSSCAAAALPVWDFSVNPTRPEGISADVQVRIARDVAPREVTWLAGGRIPLEAVTIVAGAEGAGKSFFAAELAAHVSRGAAAVYAHGAEWAPGWLRARLDAAGANAERVAMVELGWPTGTDEPSIQELLDRLIATASVARASHDCRLLVVDHLEAWAGELDQPGSPARMNYALAKLAEIARRLQIAVVALVRLPNDRGGQAARALARVSSIAPVVWLAAEDQDRPGRRLLVNVKNNLAAKRQGEAFEIAGNRIVWTAGEVDIAPAEALSPAAAWVSQRQERTAAIEWLLSALGDGPLASSELFAQAVSCGISARTLRRAAKSLGLVPRKRGFAGGWVWQLPEGGAESRHTRRPDAPRRASDAACADRAVSGAERRSYRRTDLQVLPTGEKSGWAPASEYEDGHLPDENFDEDGHLAPALAGA